MSDRIQKRFLYILLPLNFQFLSELDLFWDVAVGSVKKFPVRQIFPENHVHGDPDVVTAACSEPDLRDLKLLLMVVFPERFKRCLQIVGVYTAERVFVITGPERVLLRVGLLGRRHVGIDEPHLLCVGKTDLLMRLVRHEQHAHAGGNVVEDVRKTLAAAVFSFFGRLRREQRLISVDQLRRELPHLLRRLPVSWFDPLLQQRDNGRGQISRQVRRDGAVEGLSFHACQMGLIVLPDDFFKNWEQLTLGQQQIDFRIASDESVKVREVRADISGTRMVPVIDLLQLQQPEADDRVHRVKVFVKGRPGDAGKIAYLRNRNPAIRFRLQKLHQRGTNLSLGFFHCSFIVDRIHRCFPQLDQATVMMILMSAKSS